VIGILIVIFIDRNTISACTYASASAQQGAYPSGWKCVEENTKAMKHTTGRFDDLLRLSGHFLINSGERHTPPFSLDMVLHFAFI
jgi:hypothetical protein